MAAVSAQSSYGRNDSDDGADKLRLFLSGICDLPVGNTFYTMVTSVINLVKFRRLRSPILSAAEVLNFIAVLMSILGLQTAMIAQFSTEGENYRRMMNAITGGAVWLSVILTAVYMLYLSSKQRDEVKSDEQV